MRPRHVLLLIGLLLPPGLWGERPGRRCCSGSIHGGSVRDGSVHDYQSRLPISTNLSDGLVGILRRPKGFWQGASRATAAHWLFDAHGNPIVPLDFSGFQVPRDGLDAWLHRRVRIRGERVVAPDGTVRLRVTSLRPEESGEPPAAGPGRCGHSFTTSPWQR